MKHLSKKQILEWADSPVNSYLIKLIEKYCLFLDTQRGIEAYCPGKPQKTQEILATLNGTFIAWGDAVDLLKGDLSLVMEDEEDDSYEIED